MYIYIENVYPVWWVFLAPEDVDVRDIDDFICLEGWGGVIRVHTRAAFFADTPRLLPGAG